MLLLQILLSHYVTGFSKAVKFFNLWNAETQQRERKKTANLGCITKIAYQRVKLYLERIYAFKIIL